MHRFFFRDQNPPEQFEEIPLQNFGPMDEDDFPDTDTPEIENKPNDQSTSSFINKFVEFPDYSKLFPPNILKTVKDNLPNPMNHDFVFISSPTNPTNEAAKTAARTVGPHVYKLTGQRGKRSRYFVMGCQGDAGDGQKAVSDLMFQIAQNPDKRPDFILMLGDNFYDNGVSAPDDPVFKSQFEYMYAKFAALGIPVFLLLGNHCGRRHEGTRFYPESYKGENVEINQVAHHYIPDDIQYPAPKKNYQSIDELIQLFSPKKDAPPDQEEKIPLNLEALQLFNMPYFFYSLILDEAETQQLICLNSNSLLRDFLNYVNGTTPPGKINQVEWLLNVSRQAKEANRDITLAMHHPLRSSGKRHFAENYDSDHYLSMEEIIDLNKLFHSNTASYNELLCILLLEKLGIKPSKVLNAHDHFVSIDDNSLFFQLTSGGGGGELQEQESFIYPDVKYHLQHHAFAIVDEASVEIFTTEQQHLLYDYKKHTVIREPGEAAAEKLRMKALSVCEKFIDLLRQQETSKLQKTGEQKISDKKPSGPGLYYNVRKTYYNVRKTYTKAKNEIIKYISRDKNQAKEIVAVNDLKVYLDQPTPPSFSEMVDHLRDVVEQLPNKNLNNSLYAFLQERLSDYFDMRPHLAFESGPF